MKKHCATVLLVRCPSIHQGAGPEPVVTGPTISGADEVEVVIISGSQRILQDDRRNYTEQIILPPPQEELSLNLVAQGDLVIW
jgi:hypothetical protein